MVFMDKRGLTPTLLGPVDDPLFILPTVVVSWVFAFVLAADGYLDPGFVPCGEKESASSIIPIFMDLLSLGVGCIS